MMFLRREHAPITQAAWDAIDGEAARVLKLNLAARQLVDFRGPLGWDVSNINLGRTQALKPNPQNGVSAALRRVQPLMELRIDFQLALDELYAIDRGAEDADLQPVVQAAMAMAMAEDSLVFNGYKPGGIDGILAASPHKPHTISKNYQDYPFTVTQAVETLRKAGVVGPFAIALGPRCYAGLMQATNAGGYPLLKTLQNVLDGPIVRAPQVDGAAVLSVHSGAFEMVVGQDISVGYSHHDRERIHLYLIQSLTFRTLAPESAVPLRYKR